MSIIITILIYSAIATIVIAYKDSSSYFHTDTPDIIIGGPVLWCLMLVLLIIRPLFQKRKEKERKLYTTEQIDKTTKRISDLYGRKKNKTYIDFNRMVLNDSWEVDGWESLMINSPKYELLNKRFERMMLFQKEECVKSIKKYFLELNDDEYEEIQKHYYYEKPVYKHITV